MLTFAIPLRRFSFFLIPCRFARDEIHCVALCVRATMKESEPASHHHHQYSNEPQEWQQQQQQQQEAPAAITEVASALLLPWLTGTLGVFKDHELHEDWWLSKGFYRFSNVFIRLIVLPWMGEEFSNKVMNQKFSLLPQVLRCSSNSQSSTAFRRGTGCKMPITFRRPFSFARSWGVLPRWTGAEALGTTFKLFVQ